MRNNLLHKGMILALALSVMAPLVAPKVFAADKPGPPLKLKVGDTAPNFSLLAFDGHDVKKVSLADFRGKKDVVLAFYVFAFTGG